MGTATFELGKEYHEAECPPINRLLEDGACDWTMKQPDQTKCAYFCQIRTAFYPAQEIPIPNTYCRGPRRCSIPAGRVIQLDGSSINAGANDAQISALEHGVSGGFDPGLLPTVATAGAGEVTIGEGECGYFTWIGTRKEVCGSLTQATRHEPAAVPGGEPSSPYCQHPATTTPNYCAAEPYYGGALRDPSAYGRTVFVRVDCLSRRALPADDDGQQDPLFSRFPDVALEAEKLDEVLQSWVSTTCTLRDDFFFITFSMRGRGLRDDDDEGLGPSGIRLLHKMQSCRAAVTGWTFDYTPDDNEYDWHASGAVDPFDSKCPGDALLAVGANHRGEC
ncbi:hypothetical protein F5Y14DRAFT_422079 [Nemania sp. NC0429]|nr:hypothetical protein F5Y14DRAFT_422079 [Nemania sp. NC0429]